MEISQHARRKKEGPKYEFINDWFEGDLDNLKKYIIRHTTERANTSGASDSYSVRVARTSNDNELRPAIEVHLGHLNQVIDWGDLDKNERITPIIEDATGYGCDIYEQLDEIKQHYMLHGFVGVLVEGAEVPEGETRDQAKAGERSYQVLFSALNIINWKIFKKGARKGQFSEVIVQNDPVIVDKEARMSFSRFFFPNGGASDTETFTREEYVAEFKEWKDGTVEAKLVSAIPGSLPIIPFVTIGRGIKDTRFYDVAQSNRKLFNDKSVVDHTNYCQGFERTIVSGCSPDKLKPISEGQILAIENENISIHAIPAGEQTAMMLRVSQQEQRTRKYARFDADSLLAEDSKEGQSAQSKAHDMAGRIGQYENILDKVDATLNRIFTFHCEYEGVEPPAKKITSAREFGLDDRTQKLTERNILYSHARELGAFETQKAIVQIEIDEALDISDEEKKILRDEITGLEKVETALPGVGGFGAFQ